MSADNWAQCPRCVFLRGKEIDRMQAGVDASYGKVSVEEFDAMRADLAAKRDVGIDNTWREDWEIGLDGDEFYVIYRGGCSVCGAAKKFNHSEILDVTP